MKSSRLLRSMAAHMQAEQYLFLINVVALPTSKSVLGMALPQKSQGTVGVCTSTSLDQPQPLMTFEWANF
jgi:hypothetical protein